MRFDDHIFHFDNPLKIGVNSTGECIDTHETEFTELPKRTSHAYVK